MVTFEYPTQIPITYLGVFYHNHPRSLFHTRQINPLECIVPLFYSVVQDMNA